MAKKIKVKKNENKYIKNKSNIGFITILGWIFGIMFMLSGLINLAEEVIKGITMFLSGLIIFPPFGNLLRIKFDINLNRWTRVGLFFLIIILGGMISGLISVDKTNNINNSIMKKNADLNNIDNDNLDNSAEKKVNSKNIDENIEKEVESIQIVEEIKISLGEKNALTKAKTYLNTIAFSREGLIHQLKFEGFTTEQAEYGVENCGANWNEQATKKAKTYLITMAFSKKGLIQQLEFEKFTTKQAEYGVENCNANWNEQAAKKAETYLNTIAFSREDLIRQLEFEGFTTEQAEYGVTSVGY